MRNWLCHPREKVVGGEAGEGEAEEETKALRLKVKQLQSHVRTLTQYYQELMVAFEHLKERRGEPGVSVPLPFCVEGELSLCDRREQRRKRRRRRREKN